jgi:dephospho-CoA kinase
VEITGKKSMILGITGAIGCGKSTVLAYFSSNNWYVYDADKLCHQLYDGNDRELCEKIAARWGENLLLADGGVDRKKLGKIVFADRKELDVLTSMLYPALQNRITGLIDTCRKDNRDAAFELPLLYEAGFETLFDKVLAVWSSPEIRHQRLRQYRMMTDADIAAREKQQLSADEKLEKADFAVINNGTEQELNLQLEIIFKGIKKNER